MGTRLIRLPYLALSGSGSLEQLILSTFVGLARNIYERTAYVSTSGVAAEAGVEAAMRMSAPERLEDDTCSTKSDVWTFGM